MTQSTPNKVSVRELSVVISARNHNPTILNPDFLERNEIVGTGWELASTPICVEPFAQVAYKNGISVTSELDKLVFTQTGDVLTEDNIMVMGIVRKYLMHVPHVEYRGIGVNPKGDVDFRSENLARRFILDRLLGHGPWHQYGKGLLTADVRFVFDLEGSRLFLTVQEARRKKPDGAEHQVLVFAANFHYDLSARARRDLIEAFDEVLAKWRSCFGQFREIVDTVFLGEEVYHVQ